MNKTIFVITQVIWKEIKTPLALVLTFLILWGICLPLTPLIFPHPFEHLPQIPFITAMFVQFCLVVGLIYVFNRHQFKDLTILAALGFLLALTFSISSFFSSLTYDGPQWIIYLPLVVGLFFFFFALNRVVLRLYLPSASTFYKWLRGAL